MTTLLLSPASTGKTQHCIEQIHTLRAQDKLAPVWVILPNQDHVRAFRRRLVSRKAGCRIGVMGVELGTFYNFYAEILARAGRLLARLTEPLQYRLIQDIVARRYGDQSLRGSEITRESYYAPLRDKPGFIAELRELIEELKRARIQPDVFASAVMGQGERLEELAALYADYQAWLMPQDWADAEGQGWLAEIALREHPDLCRDVRLLIVDGFDEFNPTQLVVLKTLAQRAGQTILTLTGDITRERPILRRFARARDMLTSSLHAAPIPLASPIARHPLHAHLETSLFDPAPRKHAADGAIEFVEAQNRREETRAALRWIKARVVHDRIPLRDIALVARDLDPYRAFIEETAIEFGVPVSMAGGLPLARNPAVTALLSLLALPVDDWPRRRVLDTWRSPYFNWSVGQNGVWSESFAEVLDTISRNGVVIRGLAQWREAFDLAATMTAERDQDEPAPPVTPGDAASVRKRFEAFVARITPPDSATVRDYVAFVENLIGDEPGEQDTPLPYNDLSIVAHARENDATRDRDVAALRAFKDVLRGQVLAESVFAQNAAPTTYAAFLRGVRDAVEAASYEIALPDAGRDVLFAAPVLRVRGLAFRAVAILGLAEGDFPQIEREDVLLTESDRHWLRERGLPIEPRLRGDEATFFYEAVTRASERLLLSRPYLADDGQAWEASPYWNHIHQIVDAPVRHVRPEDPLPIDDIASSQEASIVEQDGILPYIERGAAILRARLAEQANDPFEGDLSSLAAVLRARFPADFVWSASRLESYGACPMDFWTGVALGLEPREPLEEGYNVRAFGSMVHAILERVYQRASDPADVEIVLTTLPDVAREVFDSAPSDYGFRPTVLWGHQRAEIEQTIRATIMTLAEEARGYVPRFYEQAFGFKGQPLLDANGVKLHGFIDRVDTAPGGCLRVMDYKTGSTPISAQDLNEGRRLQLPLYALAARDALKLGDVDGGFYWHVGSARPSSLKLESFEGGVEAAIQVALAHTRRYVEAIRTGRFEPRVPPGGCPSYCPATAWCWRFSGAGR
jgi:ATP-dependent helicase/nuclease subunit B